MTLRLTADNARRYWHALIANVAALIDDANVLLDNQSPGRARSLLVLAQEELARANAVFEASVGAWESGGTVELSSPPGNPKHLAVSNNHRDKIAATDDFALDLGPFWGDYSAWENGVVPEPGRLPAEVDREKQDGFYVASAPGAGGRFASPLDVERAPVATELERVAQLAEMALIRDHTRKQALGNSGEDSAQDLHWMLLPYAHPRCGPTS
ncbi:AbiV family abortive infection protein [Williamsia sp. M5A3_1d]